MPAGINAQTDYLVFISFHYQIMHICLVYPSYCDTTVDLYIQAHEVMKSSRIAGFCTIIASFFWGRIPRPPYTVVVNTQILPYTHRQKLSNTTFVRRHCCGI